MDNIPKLDILNARTIKFECPEGAAVDYLTNDNGEIVSVNYSGNKANISVGAQFVFDMVEGVTKYKIEEIEPGDSNRVFILNTHKLTKSTSFLTPVVAVAAGPIGFYTNMINCYIRTYALEPLQLILLYRNVGDNNFEKLSKNLKAIPTYCTSIKHDKLFTSFIFDIPDNFANDVGLFLKGKYSNLSEVLKNRIIRFHKLKKASMLYKVLYRDMSLKKFIEMDLNESIPDNVDLYSMPEPEIEILQI